MTCCTCALRICQSDVDGMVEDSYEEISDVSIVVLWTGYEPNIDYLDPSLIPCSMTGDCKKFSIDDEDWEMKTNVFTNLVGHAEPSKILIFMTFTWTGYSLTT